MDVVRERERIGPPIGRSGSFESLRKEPLSYRWTYESSTIVSTELGCDVSLNKRSKTGESSSS